MAEKKKRTFAELGYSSLDTAEIVTLLNRVLAGYSVYMQKLRSFHWRVTGADFFDLHDKFQRMYLRAQEETDKIAERIRFFGQTPLPTLADYLKISAVAEEGAELSAFEMAKNTIKDIRTLLYLMEECIDAAKEINDNSTEYLFKSCMFAMEKDHWMLTSWVKQRI